MSFVIDIFEETSSGDTNNLLDWVAGEDYLQFSERVYDFKLYVSLIRINDGRTTVPSEDGEGWRQAGILSQVPDIPAATSSTVNYNLQRPAAVPEAGVTIKFNANPTTTGARTYIQGFPSAITNLNAGTLIEFTNGSLAGRVTTLFSDGNVGPGIRINIENSSRNNTLTQKVAEFVSIINNDVRFNIEALVSSIDSEWIEIFYTDKEIDIVPTNITVKTQSDAGIPSNLPDDYSMTIPSEAPTKIVEAPLAVWSIDTGGGGGGGPTTYVKSSSITGTTSISLTDQDDNVTTFTPAGGSSGSEDIPVFYRPFVNSTIDNTQNVSTRFTDYDEGGSAITDDIYSIDDGVITFSEAGRYETTFITTIITTANNHGITNTWQISQGNGGGLAPQAFILQGDTIDTQFDRTVISTSYIGDFNANDDLAMYYVSNSTYTLYGTLKIKKLIQGSGGGGSGFAPNPSGGTAGQVIVVNAAEDNYEFEDKLTTFDIVDWTTLVLAPTSGDQTGTIGSTGFEWVRQCIYKSITYFRVTGTDKDGWYINTTTNAIGTIVPNAQRI